MTLKVLKARPQAAPEDTHDIEVKHNNASPPQTGSVLKPKAKAKTKTKPKKSSDSSGTLLKDLNLMGDDSLESLRDFCGKYKVKTNLERTLVFVYYLQHKKSIAEININHIFTCYRNIDGLKIPGHLKQNLQDTSSKKGWLVTSNMEDITVPVTGVNYIEHDLPKNDN